MMRLSIDSARESLPTTLAVVAASLLVIFLTRFYAARQFIRKLQRAGLPMPPFHTLAGHFLVFKRVTDSLPKDVTMHGVFRRIANSLPDSDGDVFYFDLWPFSQTLLVVTSPHAAQQVQEIQLDMPRGIVSFLETITGGPGLLSRPVAHPEWKRWRRAFGSGFSEGYMIGLAPAIAGEVAVLRRLLLERCRGGRSEVFQLEELTLKMTFDVIGAVTLDAKLNFQTGDNVLARSLRTQIEWADMGTDMNPFTRYLSARPIVHWVNSRRMNGYIADEIDKRIDERLAMSEPEAATPKRSRSVASLLLDELLDENDINDGKVSSSTRESIKREMTPHIRTFLFAGHDTTSSTLLFTFFLLSQHPSVVDRLGEEHTEVFGPDSSAAEERINQDPLLLNTLPFTTAVIKEVLRLFAPAASMRMGRPGAEIVDGQGRRYPTENCWVWTLTQGIHLNPRYWVDPEAFRPERFLAGEEDELHPQKGAWRPFEFGAKSCIGQTLAILELKVALVMTLREIDVQPAYEEWDRMHPTGRKLNTVNGSRCYQQENGGGGAHPAEGLPVRVSLRG